MAFLERSLFKKEKPAPSGGLETGKGKEDEGGSRKLRLLKEGKTEGRGRTTVTSCSLSKNIP
jgi:hypothetical protein